MSRTNHVKSFRRRLVPAILLLMLGATDASRAQNAAADIAAKPPVAKFDGKSLSAAPSAEDLRPNGPVTVTADRSDWIRGQSMLLVGNVVMVSDTITLRGDRMEIQQFPDGNYLAHLFGVPAHVDHPGIDAENPRLLGDSRTMDYDSRSRLLVMTGDAHAIRGNDDITGDTIRYHVLERHVEASSIPGAQQVHIVLQPAPAQGAPAVQAPLPQTKPIFPATPSSSGPSAPSSEPAPASSASAPP